MKEGYKEESNGGSHDNQAGSCGEDHNNMRQLWSKRF